MAYEDLLEEPVTYKKEGPKMVQVEITPTFFEHNRFLATNTSKPIDS